MKLSRQRDLIGLIYPFEFFYGHDQDFNQRMILIYPDVSHRSVHSSTVRWNMS